MKIKRNMDIEILINNKENCGQIGEKIACRFLDYYIGRCTLYKKLLYYDNKGYSIRCAKCKKMFGDGDQ